MQQRLVAMLAHRLQLGACTTRASPLAAATCIRQSLQPRTATWAPHPSAAVVASSSALLARQPVVACHARSRIDTSSLSPDLYTALSSLPGSQQQLAAIGVGAALGKAAQQLGNRFFLVQCGQYHSEHPQAGQDAYALLQLVVVQVSPSSEQDVAPVLQPLEQQQPEAVLTVLAYEVDVQHGPTGRAFSSPSAFVKQTTKRQQHNALTACHIIFPGAAPVRLVSWYQQQLQPLGVLRTPPGLKHVLRGWAHKQLASAGFEVMPTPGGTSSSRAAGDPLRLSEPLQQPDRAGPAEELAGAGSVFAQEDPTQQEPLAAEPAAQGQQHQQQQQLSSPVVTQTAAQQTAIYPAMPHLATVQGDSPSGWRAAGRQLFWPRMALSRGAPHPPDTIVVQDEPPLALQGIDIDSLDHLDDAFKRALKRMQGTARRLTLGVQLMMQPPTPRLPGQQQPPSKPQPAPREVTAEQLLQEKQREEWMATVMLRSELKRKQRQAQELQQEQQEQELEQQEQPQEQQESSSSSSSRRRLAVREGQHNSVYQQPSSSHLVAFTDGSNWQNGRRSAVGAYAVAWPHAPRHTMAAPLPGVATSIRAELQAGIQACQTADELDPGRGSTLVLYTDSKFLIQVVTKWMWGWAQHNWTRAPASAGGPRQAIANPDLVQQLYQHAQVRDMLLVKVKSHSGKKDWKSVWNAKADRLATQATRREAERRGKNRRR